MSSKIGEFTSEDARYDESLSVILPAYNEEAIIEEMVLVTLNSLSERFEEFEVIVVDDGSVDNTGEIIDRLASEYDAVKNIVHAENTGKATAFHNGFETSKFDSILLLDADLELDPNRLDDFIKIREDENADIVVGSKLHPESEIRYTLFRTILSRGYAALIGLLFTLDIRDPQTGMKLFTRRSLQECLPELKVKGLAFSVELLIIAQRRGFRITEAPISLDYSGDTSLSIQAIMGMFLDTITMLREHRYS